MWIEWSQASGQLVWARATRPRKPAASRDLKCRRWKTAGFSRASIALPRTWTSLSQTYRFDEAANRIYDFFWGEFCDWYIELIKPRLNFEEGADTGAARTACSNLVNLFEASLRLLHPVMPFITEEIWHAIYDGKPPLKSIALAAYPAADAKQIDLAAETEMAILQDLIVTRAQSPGGIES